MGTRTLRAAALLALAGAGAAAALVPAHAGAQEEPPTTTAPPATTQTGPDRSTWSVAVDVRVVSCRRTARGITSPRALRGAQVAVRKGNRIVLRRRTNAAGRVRVSLPRNVWSTLIVRFAPRSDLFVSQRFHAPFERQTLPYQLKVLFNCARS